MEGKCDYCGKVFTKNSGVQKYCSKKCYAAQRRESYDPVQRREERKKRKWKPAGTENDIVRINKLAREKGLSYGQYVVQYGGGESVRGQKVSTAG